MDRPRPYEGRPEPRVDHGRGYVLLSRRTATGSNAYQACPSIRIK